MKQSAVSFRRILAYVRVRLLFSRSTVMLGAAPVCAA